MPHLARRCVRKTLPINFPGKRGCDLRHGAGRGLSVDSPVTGSEKAETRAKLFNWPKGKLAIIRNNRLGSHMDSAYLPVLAMAPGPESAKYNKPDQVNPDPTSLPEAGNTDPQFRDILTGQNQHKQAILHTGRRWESDLLSRAIRPRAARLATGILTCGPRRQKHTRDPHLPVMRVTMATTLHSGVYPPPNASRWRNRACRAPLLPV